MLKTLSYYNVHRTGSLRLSTTRLPYTLLPLTSGLKLLYCTSKPMRPNTCTCTSGEIVMWGFGNDVLLTTCLVSSFLLYCLVCAVPDSIPKRHESQEKERHEV